jgi:hypothetical protein
MASKEEIAEAIRIQFANVKERGRVLAQALKARADIAATRRRLRSAFADLGEEIYARMTAGEKGPWSEDVELEDFRTRIEGVKAELRQRERALQEIMAGPDEEEEDAGKKPDSESAAEEAE